MQQSHYPYSRYLENTFGGKTYKIVVSSGLTCPTWDGKISKQGCAFCDIRGSSSFFGKKGRGKGIREQLEKRLPEIKTRFSAKNFLAYFQSYTNTYDSVPRLRDIYEEALAVPEIRGLCISTRPDCLPDEVIDLLEELACKHYLSLELGIQSFEDPTLLWLGRGHDRQCSIDALERLRKRAPHVHVAAHMIFGSPPESKTVGKDAALLLNSLGVRGAKLHQLMVLENSELANRFRQNPFPTLNLDEYAEVVIDFLEHLSPHIYIERLYATATHLDECLAPEWSKKRWDTHNQLRDVFEKRNCKQGAKL